MSQSQPPLNPWILSFITQHHQKLSRFEIDKQLIADDYNPAEIELVWAHLNKIPPKPKAKGKRFFKYGCLILLGLLIIPIILLLITLATTVNPALPDPLPAYPNGLKLEAKKVGSKDLLSFHRCFDGSLDAFSGKQYQAFATFDSESLIWIFYLDAVEKLAMKHVSIYSDSFLCVSIDLPGPFLSTTKPANAVRVLNPANPEDNKIITEYFPQTPANAKIIVLIQGYVYRTVA